LNCEFVILKRKEPNVEILIIVSRCVACVLARSACAHVEQFEVDLLLEEEEENDEEPILKFSIVLQYTGVG